MAKFKFKLDKAGVGQFLKSEPMQALISQKVSEIHGRLGEGYASNTSVGKTRAQGIVIAETKKAKRDNLKNNTILKALR